MYEQGLLNEALPLLNTAQKILKLAAQEENLIAADIYTALASILFEKGNPQTASELKLRTIAIHEKLLPDDHPHLANSYMNLANALNGLHRFEESAEFHLKAVEIREKKPHLARPMLGLSYGNLGRLWMRMGKLDDASSVLVKSIAIQRETMGPESSKLAKYVFRTT
jgi:tetratricopeptide (TPR) repeat protein